MVKKITRVPRGVPRGSESKSKAKPEIKNEILRGLTNGERKAVLSSAEFVTLKQHEVLHEAGETIKFGYFPNSGIISLLSVLSDGKSVEVGVVGKEGFVGLPLAVGFRSSPTLAICQVPSTAFRIPAATLTAGFREWPLLARAVNRHSLNVGMQASQVAACNRLHEVDARLARWLLMCHDRLEHDSIALTHEFLGQMLGIRRASVTVAVGILEKAGLIGSERGQVAILDRKGLEDLACECYNIIIQQMDRWQTDVR